METELERGLERIGDGLERKRLRTGSPTSVR